jgi:hypothetical protein
MSGISSNFDPRVLLKIMGAIAEVLDKGIDPETLGVGKVLKDKSVRSLRDAIDSYLPSFYLVDTEAIVNEVFNQLEPDSEYFYSVVYPSKITIDPASIPKKPKPKPEPQSESERFAIMIKGVDERNAPKPDPNKMTPEQLNVYREWLEAKKLEKSTLQTALNNSIDNQVGKINFDALMKSLKDLRDRIQGQRTSTGNAIVTQADLKLAVRDIFKLKSSVAANFGQIPSQQAAKFIDGYTTNRHYLFYAPSFEIVKSRVHTMMDKAVFENFFKAPEVKLNAATFKVGNFVAAGHAGYRSYSGTLFGVTPLLINSSLVLEIFGTQGGGIPAQEDMSGLVQQFLLETIHKNYIINFNLDTKYNADAQVFFDLGISFVTSQNFSINSFKLSPEENSLVKALINNYEVSIKDKIKNGMKPGDPVFDYMIRQVQRSPTLAKVINLKAFSPLTKQKANFPAKSTIDTIKMDEVVKQAKVKKGRTKQPVKSTKKPVAPKATPLRSTARKPQKIETSTVNLSKLMLMINSNLHDQIKKNMGTGSRRDILNYRTGRFAQSARVERLSESRQGMITAFYSYMKNPYATFSRGGRQDRPYTRDPKLLISKSIRELAGTQVANRMRAVLV